VQSLKRQILDAPVCNRPHGIPPPEKSYDSGDERTRHRKRRHEMLDLCQTWFVFGQITEFLDPAQVRATRA